ncbi:MAG: DUF1080 domain-containing protein [Planctomycetes bacterium]|nr:DUF1080 domain-containing protein [Planctomycetota bacterium]
MIISFCRGLLVCFFLVQSFEAVTAEVADGTTVVLPEFEVVGVTSTVAVDGKRKVWGYNYPTLDTSTPESRERTYKPYHDVYAPDGSVLLTKGPGGLYTHHRGLFYGFSKITYGDGKKCDTWHCGAGAFQSHEKLDKGTATIYWHGEDGEVFAHEEREVRSVPTSSDVQGTLLEFRSRLEPVGEQPIHLDGDPQHAGFQFRAAQEVAEKTKGQTYFLRTDGKGKLGETRNWNHKDLNDPMNEECTNRPWNAMSFVVGDKRYTALYMDHPSNPKPARYSERDYGRFGSYFVTDVTQDKPLNVKYRLWLQEGEMTVDECAALTAEFTGAKITNVKIDANNVAPEGFVALFNGKDLAGWKGLVGNPKTRAAETSEEKQAEAQASADVLMQEHWSAVDGALVYDSSKEGANICTAKDYGNFELMLDWKIEAAGDSGIYLRGCPQVQIWDAEHEPFFKNGADKGSGSLWNNKEHERFPLVKADRPVGEWNHFHIKMVGENVTIKLNGQLVVDNVVLENYWQRDQPVYPTGQIELQKHDGTLWFKNIFLRELP